MRNTKLAACFLTLFVLLGVYSGEARSQTRKELFKQVEWEFSIPKGLSRDKATVGMRDKTGLLGSYEANFVITGPKNTTYQNKFTVLSDEWANIDFPMDFYEVELPNGTYRVVFYADGIAVGRGTFKFQQSR